MRMVVIFQPEAPAGAWVHSISSFRVYSDSAQHSANAPPVGTPAFTA